MLLPQHLLVRQLLHTLVLSAAFSLSSVMLFMQARIGCNVEGAEYVV